MLYRYFVRLIAATVLFLATAPAFAAPPPLEAFGNLPDVESMALSNDGTRLSAVMKIGGERVVILMTAEIDTLRMMRLGEAKVRSMEWLGNDNVLVTMSRTEVLGPEYISGKAEFWHAFLVPVDQAKPEKMVFDKDATMLNAIFGNYGVRNIDGKWTAFVTGVEKEKGARGYFIGSNGPSLFAIDPEKQNWRQVAPQGSRGESTSWLLGSDGKVAATFSISMETGANGAWQIKVPDGPVLAKGNAPRGDAGLVALGKDGTTIIYAELDESEQRTIWYEVPLDASAPPKRFAVAEEIDRLFYDRSNGRIIGISRMGEENSPDFYVAEQQAVIDKVFRTFRKFHVELVDWTPEFSRVLVHVTGNGDSGTWYLVDMAQTKASAVGYDRVALPPEYVGTVSMVEYTAQDGTQLDGVLTLPPGIEAKSLPLVMLPHGGPHSHDDVTFDWWAQAFASRGYAVFQPNFRGSTNRDEAFLRAGFGQWGKAMQTDISDAIAELQKRGIVDPSRVCIMGASYGGYAALAGVTLQKGIYRCSVAVAPVSDLASLFNDEYYSSGQNPMLRRSLTEELGPKDGFAAVSPLRFAAQADAPILLIHGKDDTVVPFDQSSRMADALKDAGKDYRMVVLKEEDHWLSRAPTRLQMLQEALSFVQEHNPAD